MPAENREVWRWEQNNIKLWILKKRNQLKYDVLHFWIFNFLGIYWIQFYFYGFSSKTIQRRFRDWNKSLSKGKMCVYAFWTIIYKVCLDTLCAHVLYSFCKRNWCVRKCSMSVKCDTLLNKTISDPNLQLLRTTFEVMTA